MIRRSPPKEETWASYRARFPHQTIDIAKRLFDQLDTYVRERQLDWKPKLLPGWLSYKAGRENRVTVVLRAESPVMACIKMRRSPDRLGVANPYPELRAEWDEMHTEWIFLIPTASAVPDLSLVLDLVPRI
jgi:hypothetical protein